MAGESALLGFRFPLFMFTELYVKNSWLSISRSGSKTIEICLWASRF